MQQYIELLQHVLMNGTRRDDRTGTGTIGVFGAQMRVDLKYGFPLLTTKKLFWKGIVGELLWMLRGETNIKSLQADGIHIWDEWADVHGELGPVYGHQWRSWPHHDGHNVVDQIADVIQQIKTNPNSRRLMVSAWNPADVPDMALPPCHCLFQFYVSNGKLSCQLYQRSADIFLGVPFNIASYALLTHIIAKLTGLEVGEFIHTFGDLHIYKNHVDQVLEQIKRDIRPKPKLIIDNRVTSIDDLKIEDFRIFGYEPHPAIKAPVAV